MTAPARQRTFALAALLVVVSPMFAYFPPIIDPNPVVVVPAGTPDPVIPAGEPDPEPTTTPPVTAQTPEPGTLLAAALGLGTLYLLRRRHTVTA